MNITMQDIENSTELYAALSRQLCGEIDRMESEINQVRMKHLPFVKNLAAKVFAMRDELTGMIDEGRSLFVKPKSITISGIRVGIQKSADKVIFDDEEELLQKIRELYGPTSTMLIKSSEKVMMQPLKALSRDELELLGCTKVDGQEEVMVKDVNLERAGGIIQGLLAQPGTTQKADAQVIELPALPQIRQAA